METAVEDWGEFEEILEQAELNASKEGEINFTSDMRERFNKYGVRTRVSTKQLDWLKKIGRYGE